MNLDSIPCNILYKLCKYLSFIDIINMSRTCKQLYILIEKDNYFWMRLIKNHFGPHLYQRYVHEIFQNEKNSDYVFYRTEKDITKFEKSFRNQGQCFLCNYWLFNVLECKDNSRGYIVYKRIIKQKKHPRTKELKMSLTKQELFEYYSPRSEYLSEENILQVRTYKFVYFYLIEPKRLLGIDLYALDLTCSRNHRYCFNKKYPMQEDNLNSLTGRCIRLHSMRRSYLCGVKGKFKSIWPGIYEIICRIKLDKNNEYFSYYNERCNKDHESETSITCYFQAFAENGLDCWCNENKMNYEWFESNYYVHNNINWFNQSMGTIKVFEMSDIYFSFRIELDYGYRNVLLDYVQLKIIE